MLVHWTRCDLCDYVNDLIFWSQKVPQINQVAMKLRDLGVDLEKEDNAAGEYWGQGLGVPCILHFVHSVPFSALS
jgi:hypothetical protein